MRYILLSVTLVLVLLFFRVQKDENAVDNVIKELYKHANLKEEIKLRRVAVGYNTNLDLACSGVDLLSALNVDPLNVLPFESYESISTLEEFARSFGYFFQQGSAAERAATNSEIWNMILEPLFLHEFNQCQVLPGGNAALISNRLAELGVSVLLGGPVGNTLEPLLHDSIQTLREFHQQQSNEPFPEVSDEIHLIMEFSTNERWGPIESPRANRFIISHDIQNSHLSVIEEFHKMIERYNPQLLIIAGSHLLESLPDMERSIRLQSLATALTNVPTQTAIHLEIAGVGDNHFLTEMAMTLLPLVDSIGLNEQELGALYGATGGTAYSPQDFVSPSVSVASDAIEHLMKLPFVENGNQKHEINRVHLHYLSFHMIGQRRNPRSEFYNWNKDRAFKSVAAGSLATSIQACGENGELPDVSQLHINEYGTNELFTHFNTSSMEFWVAPVVVCNVPKRTVGLGDCISATGIAHHFQ